jgi:hypothetical protein
MGVLSWVNMRTMFGCLAVLLGAVSIALAARYGYKGADTEIDGLISGVVFGLVALCAFLFDAAAVRLWFMQHKAGSAVIGLIAAAALVVTFTNSLGAIAGRADTTQAERTRVSDAHRDNRAELQRLQAALAAMPAFTPTDGAAVAASRRSADTATANKVAECGDGGPRQRGPNCRQRELDEQAAATILAHATAAKSTTDRAAKLEADIAVIRAKLGSAAIVQNVNPLGSALEQMLGAAAATLMAWQQAIVAAVFELCLVGVMVIYELLGHASQPAQRQIGDTRSQKALGAIDAARISPPQEIEPSASPARRKMAHGSVKSFVRNHVFPADGERVEIKRLMRDYRAWCARENVMPLDVSAFLDELEKLCRKLGIETKVGDDQRVYCLGVNLKPVAATTHASVH